MDQTTIEFQQTGSSETSINLQEALLDENLNYVFCVDSLNVPLHSVPINSLEDIELFRIIRRNVGETLDYAPETELVGPRFVYTLNRKFYDVQTFVRDLNNFARGVEDAFTQQGLTDFRTYGGNSNADDAEDSVVAPLRALEPRDVDGINEHGYYDFLRFKLAVDGSLILWASHDFSNNFVFQFSRTGAEILGLGDKIVAVTRHMIDPVDFTIGPAQVDYFLAITNVGGEIQYNRENFVVTDVTGDNMILAGNNIRETQTYSEHSLYTVCDQRVKISLSSHLPMQNNMLVREGKETVDRNIVEVFFDNKITSAVTFDEDGTFSEQAVSSTVFAGQYPFIRKSDRSKQWHRLLTTYDLRFLRFHLYITYRRYDSSKDKWEMKTDRLKIAKDRYWDFSLRFLSEV